MINDYTNRYISLLRYSSVRILQYSNTYVNVKLNRNHKPKMNKKFFSAFKNKDDFWLHSLFLAKHIYQISRQLNIG